MNEPTIAAEPPAPELPADELAGIEPQAAGAEPSRGQQVVDRFMAAARRIDSGTRELDTALAWIDGPKAGNAPPGPLAVPIRAKPKATSFFEGMDMIASFLEELAARQEKSVGALKRLF